MSKLSQLNQQPSGTCKALHSVWNNLTKVWTLPVIHELGLKEPSRFNELRKRIPGISATSLTERLTELVSAGVVGRKVYPETPPRVEYSLTKKGRELQDLLCEFADWAKKWNKQIPIIRKAAPEAKKQVLIAAHAMERKTA